MPAVEKYGAQPPIELFEFVDKGWFYDKDHFKFRTAASHVNFLCSSGGRNEITLNLCHFNLINLPQPDEKTLKLFSNR